MSEREDSPVEKVPSSYRNSKKSPGSKASHSRSRSRSHGRGSRYYSRSRSRTPPRRKKTRYSRSRSRSYSPYHSRRHRGEGRSSYRHRSRSHSPMSSRRRHASSREHPITSKCLGIFGLSLYTQERDLRECFGRYGPMDDVQVVYDHQTGRSRGFAFLYFRNLEDAEEAKERAAGTEIDGRKIRVDYSITQRAHTPTPGIYLGKPTGSGYRSSRRSTSPYARRHSGYSRSRSRSRSYSPRRY